MSLEINVGHTNPPNLGNGFLLDLGMFAFGNVAAGPRPFPDDAPAEFVVNPKHRRRVKVNAFQNIGRDGLKVYRIRRAIQ